MEAGGSTVRIAVNDVSGPSVLFSSVDDEFILSSAVPIRAVRSLSRLDAVIRAQKHSTDGVELTGARETSYQLAYKCTSFPRIARCSSVDDVQFIDDADSLSPRLSNVTLSQDFDGELLTLSISNLCVPGHQQQLQRTLAHPVSLTRSVSARNVRPPTSTTSPLTTGTALNLLSPPATGAASTATLMVDRRRVTRAKSCPSMSPIVQLSPSPSSQLTGQSAVSTTLTVKLGTAASPTTSKPGKGRRQFDADVDLDRERVTDLPVIATTDFPDFLPDQSNPSVDVQTPVSAVDKQWMMTAAGDVSASVTRHCDVTTDLRLLRHVGTRHIGTFRSCRHRAPELIHIKCLQWLNSLDHGAA